VGAINFRGRRSALFTADEVARFGRAAFRRDRERILLDIIEDRNRNASPYERIRVAGALHQRIFYNYNRKYDGLTGDYVVEPYERKNGYLYVYHPLHRSIESHIFSRIRLGSVRILPGRSQRFTPRWPIRL